MIELIAKNHDGTFVAVVGGYPYHIVEGDEPLWSQALAASEVLGDALPVEPEPLADLQPSLPDISARQLRLWLVRQGVALSAVDQAIDEMAEPQRSEASIEWEYATTFRRSNPFIEQIGSVLGLSPEQIDQGFLEASQF